MINWRKSKENIRIGIDTLINGKLSTVKNVTKESLGVWKNAILNKVDQKISTLKRKIKLLKSNSIFKQAEVTKYLEDLHQKFVLVPIDKAANNIAIVCKKFYVEVILKEIGIIGNPNPTYSTSTISSNKIINDNIEYSKHFGFKISEAKKTLPIMYWLPKMHKIQ